MYDGYNMGGLDIYNPWSIVNYIGLKKLIPYWVNTSANKMIRSAMQNNNASFYEDYDKLIQTGQVRTLVNFETSFYEIKEDSSLWGLFVNAGYLTIQETIDDVRGEYILRIPNREILREFQSLTSYYLKVGENKLWTMLQALQQQKWDKFLEDYRSILLQSVSSHDLISENSYHLLLLGMCLWLKDEYEVTSNRENGEGRYDILLKSKTSDKPSILMELKYTKDETCDLQQLAEKGLSQIEEKKYQTGIENCICVSLAHHAKQVAMKVKEEQSSK